MKLTKSFLALAVTGVFFISCKDTATGAPETTTDAAPAKEITAAVKPETASFNIEGMTCSMGCAKTIEKELAAMDGVQKATVDFDKKTAVVEFDATKLTPEKLVEKVEAAADGKTYKVTNLKSSGNQAMVITQDQEKEKKEAAKKTNKTASTKTTETKKGCCAGKKSCSADEKKASTM